MTIEHQVDAYLEYIRVSRRLSPETDRLYTLYLRRLLEHLGHRARNLTDLTPAHVSAFMSWMNARTLSLRGKMLSPAAQDKVYDTTRAFCRWAHDTGLQSQNPFRFLRPPRVPKKMRTVASKAVILRLLDAIERFAKAAPVASFQGELAYGGKRLQPRPAGSRDRALAHRDAAFFATMFYTGARISEVCQLELPDLQLQKGFIAIRHAKGDRWRVVPIHPELRPYLTRWLRARADLLARHDVRSEHVFVSLPGNGRPRSGYAHHVTAAWMERLLRKRYLPDVRDHGLGRGLPQAFTPHVLRHSIATRWLSLGVHLQDVQELLGHQDPATTTIYRHMTPGHLRRAVGRA